MFPLQKLTASLPDHVALILEPKNYVKMCTICHFI